MNNTQSQTPALDLILANPQIAQLFAQALSQQLGLEITPEILALMALDPQIGPLLEQTAELMMALKAAQGAKLNYIKMIQRKSLSDMDVLYRKEGGRVHCIYTPKQPETQIYDEPDYMIAFKAKCGMKVKKKNCGGTVAKKDKCGGTVAKDKCGGKAKKKC